MNIFLLVFGMIFPLFYYYHNTRRKKDKYAHPGEILTQKAYTNLKDSIIFYSVILSPRSQDLHIIGPWQGTGQRQHGSLLISERFFVGQTVHDPGISRIGQHSC